MPRFSSAPSDSINRPTQSPILPNFRTVKMAHTNSFNTKNSYNNVWNNCIITDDRSLVLAISTRSEVTPSRHPGAPGRKYRGMVPTNRGV